MIERNREEFINVFQTNIKRDGADKLLEWIKKSDFFTCPASARFHSNVEGGLCFHSLNAYKRFIKILECEFGEKWQEKISLESATTISLLHDICKVQTYKQELRNVKVDNIWVQKPYYTVEDQLPYGHGEKSVYIISGFMRLSREEAMAINWHMGGFDSRVRGGAFGLSDAFYQYPATLLFHIADLEATYLDETVE